MDVPTPFVPDMSTALEYGCIKAYQQMSQSTEHRNDSTNVDTGKSEAVVASCKNCKKLEDEMTEVRKVLSDTLDANGKLESDLRRCKNDGSYYLHQYLELKERSDNITSEMASILETKGDLENVNDEFANTKLAKGFKALYDNKWTSLSEWLDDNNPKLQELESIQTLTEIGKNAYKECLQLADDQLRQFLFLDVKNQIPSPIDEPALFKIRRLNGQKSGTRDVVKQRVVSKVLEKGHIQEIYNKGNIEETMIKLQEFFVEFIDYCWLMTISNPKLLVTYDVVGVPYSGVIKEHFKQYSCQETVKSEDMERDCVFAVVWPCVELEDGDGIYSKGDVITVDIGKEH